MNLWHILFLLLVILFFLKSQYLVYDRDKLYFPEKGCHLGTNRSDNET